jgi:hypothetical protein
MARSVDGWSPELFVGAVNLVALRTKLVGAEGLGRDSVGGRAYGAPTCRATTKAAEDHKVSLKHTLKDSSLDLRRAELLRVERHGVAILPAAPSDTMSIETAVGEVRIAEYI